MSLNGLLIGLIKSDKRFYVPMTSFFIIFGITGFYLIKGMGLFAGLLLLICLIFPICAFCIFSYMVGYKDASIRLEPLEAKSKDLITRLEPLEAILTDSKTRLVALEAMLKDSKTRLEPLKAKLKDSNKQLEPLEARVQDLFIMQDEALSDVRELKERLRELKERLAEDTRIRDTIFTPILGRKDISFNRKVDLVIEWKKQEELLKQEAFCNKHGISSAALRKWCRDKRIQNSVAAYFQGTNDNIAS